LLTWLDVLIKYRLDHGLVNADTKAIDLWKGLLHPVTLAWNDINGTMLKRLIAADEIVR
jgi:hypothetical protein